MRIIIFSTLCIVFFSLNAAIAIAQNDPDINRLTTEQWREDLHYFASQMPVRHRNLFFKMSKEDFDSAVRKLDERIPGLKPHEIIVELMRIVAMIGDGHTSLRVEREFGKDGIFPVKFYWFEDGLFVQTALQSDAGSLPFGL